MPQKKETLAVQVDKSHYNFDRYVSKERFMSYYYQLKYIYQIKPENILEIGPGNNFLKKVLQEDYDFQTVDIDEELDPTYRGSVTDLPIESNSFDLIACFQVLEHLPLNLLEPSLEELNRVSKEYVLISLPFSRIDFKLQFRLPLIKTRQTWISIPKFYKKNVFNGQHYWEVGNRGTSKREIRRIMERYFYIEDVLNPYENPYHLFYKLKVK